MIITMNTVAPSVNGKGYGGNMSIFVSFSCVTEDPKYQPFIGNMELERGEINGIDDVREIEEHIKNQFSDFGVTEVVITGWRRFN